MTSDVTSRLGIQHVARGSLETDIHRDETADLRNPQVSAIGRPRDETVDRGGTARYPRPAVCIYSW
jgi:hypothetical protein